MQTVAFIDVHASEDLGFCLPAGPKSQYTYISVPCVLSMLTFFHTFTYVFYLFFLEFGHSINLSPILLLFIGWFCDNVINKVYKRKKKNPPHFPTLQSLSNFGSLLNNNLSHMTDTRGHNVWKKQKKSAHHWGLPFFFSLWRYSISLSPSSLLFETFQHLILFSITSLKRCPPNLHCSPPTQDTASFPASPESPRLDPDGIFLAPSDNSGIKEIIVLRIIVFKCPHERTIKFWQFVKINLEPLEMCSFHFSCNCIFFSQPPQILDGCEGSLFEK